MSGKRFEILRVEKVKGAGSLKSMLMHGFRERETKNASPERLDQNIGPDWAVGDGKHHPKAFEEGDENDERDPKDSNRGLGRWREMTKATRVQKHNVWALEYIVTASPEMVATWDREKIKNYLDKSCDHLLRKHVEAGSSKNRLLKPQELELARFYHFDEGNPHVHLEIIPKVLKNDKYGHEVEFLSAKTFTDGRVMLSQMQTDFHEGVGVNFGLERGIKGTGRRHERVRRGYGQDKLVDREVINEHEEKSVKPRLNTLQGRNGSLAQENAALKTQNQSLISEIEKTRDDNWKFLKTLAQCEPEDLLEWQREQRKVFETEERAERERNRENSDQGEGLEF